MKTCTKCNEERELNEFTKCSRNKNGLHHCCKICLKEYRSENKDRIREYGNKYRSENKEKIKEYFSKLDRTEYVSNYNKNYKIINREYINNYYSNRKRNDPFFKFKLSVRNLIYNSYKRKFSEKSKKTIEILGCSFEEFENYIEGKFDKDMNWDNYGTYWEFDHIIQLANAKSEDDLILLNHYTNFQPLERSKNRSKNKKY